MTGLALAHRDAPGTPVGHLLWDDGGVLIEFAERHHRSVFEPHIVQALETPLLRIVREPMPDGRVKLQGQPVPMSSPGFLAGWANRLTFDPANDTGLIATPATVRSSVASRLRRVDTRNVRWNPFDKHVYSPILIQCECGARFPNAVATCRHCGRPDPLANCLDDYGGVIKNRIRSEIATGMLMRRSVGIADSVIKPMRLWLGHCESFLDSDEDPEDPETLDRAYSRLLSPIFLRRPALELLEKRVQTSDREILRSGRDVTLAVRRLYVPDASVGWTVPQEAAQALRTEIAGYWQEAFETVGTAGARLCEAAIAYQSVHKILQREANRSVFGELLKGVLRGAVAVKTFGASELVRAGIGYLKDGRDAAQFEEFSDRLETSIAAVTTAEDALKTSMRVHEEMTKRIADQVYRRSKHLMWLDYSALDGEQQAAMARRLARSCGVRAPSRRRHRRHVARAPGRSWWRRFIDFFLGRR